MDKISIIIPFNNAEKHIPVCVKSLKKQTYCNFEAIFIDDGSTDSSNEVLEQYWDDRFILLKQRKRGVSAARNNGLNNISGEYIAFMDVDDELADNYLECLITAAIQNDVAIVMCNYYEVYNSSEIKPVLLPWDNQNISSKEISNVLIPRMISDDGIGGMVWRTLVKTEFWVRMPTYFDERVEIAEDLLFSLTLYNRVDRIFIIAPCLYYYKRNYNSTINSYHKEGLPKNLEFHRIFVDLLKKEGLYAQYKDFYNINKVRMYTCELSNLSRNPKLFESLPNVGVLRRELGLESFNWRDYPISKGRKITLWMLERKMDCLLLLLYRIKEMIRLRRMIRL